MHAVQEPEFSDLVGCQTSTTEPYIQASRVALKVMPAGQYGDLDTVMRVWLLCEGSNTPEIMPRVFLMPTVQLPVLGQHIGMVSPQVRDAGAYVKAWQPGVSAHCLAH